MKLLPIFFGHFDQPSNLPRSTRNSSGGFTMIELVVVIGVLGILAAFLLAIIDPIAQFKKANDGRRKADLAQIQRAIEQYYQDNRQYPASTNDFKIKGLSGQTVEWGSPFSPYMNLLPKDPVSANKYVYVAGSGGQSYWIYASLERGSKDPQVCNGGNLCANALSNGVSSDACGVGVICNYGVSSANVSP